ncbi:MAG: hypothetical protein ACR2FX_00650 [Chthoniobacterales bacterium]
MKAIVLSWDRHRVVTQHMIRQYARLWPDHPFRFRIPFQTLATADNEREQYIQTPPDIPGTVLQLMHDLEDEEWIYWCADDKYPIQLVTQKFTTLFNYVREQPDISGLLCCRCRVTLEKPELSLLPGKRATPDGDVLLERRKWYQIWIHQFLRVKVLRYFFTHMSKDIPNAKVMDELKNDIPKPGELRLFVTEQNYAVFGESTQRGVLTRNCYQSIRQTGLTLPEWLSRPNDNDVTMGDLSDAAPSRWSKLGKVFSRASLG